ncbi:MAG: RNA 2',3'-cyclic phosphodiesterase [Desulfomonile tiedjei]|nr:RNA 2',3'-cyclic phosphodiesterase [Desulfomonile tiedjei]
MTAPSGEVRAFIAIELPEEVKSFLRAIVTDLKKTAADVKWIRPEGMHLTLKFLGNISTDLVPVLEKELGPIFMEQRRVSLRAGELGAFPGLGRPRVIWAGLHDPEGALVPLARRVEELLVPFGFAPEKRPFTPHLTLGRVRSNKRMADLVEEVRQNMDAAGPSFAAVQAVLFQSILKPSGAEYHPLVRFPFAED